MFGLRALTFFGLLLASLGNAVGQQELRVAVFDDSPPLGYRDATGKLTGFSHAIASALCAEIKANCKFEVRTLERLIDDLENNHIDIAAVGLLDTPERRKRILFTKPVYRSTTLWFAKPGTKLGAPGVRIATFRGSAQENYARTNGWETVGAITDNDMVEQLRAGIAQVAFVPLMSSLNLRLNPQFMALNLEANQLPNGELDRHASFGVNPRRPELKAALDQAIDSIKRNSTYDKINSKFLSFRVD